MKCASSQYALFRLIRSVEDCEPTLLNMRPLNFCNTIQSLMNNSIDSFRALLIHSTFTECLDCQLPPVNNDVSCPNLTVSDGSAIKPLSKTLWTPSTHTNCSMSQRHQAVLCSRSAAAARDARLDRANRVSTRLFRRLGLLFLPIFFRNSFSLIFRFLTTPGSLFKSKAALA